MQVTYIGVARASHIYWWCKCKSHISVLQVQVTYLSLPSASCVYISIASEDSSLNCIQSMASSYSLLKGLTDFAVLFSSFQAHAYVYISMCSPWFSTAPVLSFVYHFFVCVCCCCCVPGGCVCVCVGGVSSRLPLVFESLRKMICCFQGLESQWAVNNSCYQCLWKSVNLDFSCQTESRQTPDSENNQPVILWLMLIINYIIMKWQYTNKMKSVCVLQLVD